MTDRRLTGRTWWELRDHLETSRPVKRPKLGGLKLWQRTRADMVGRHLNSFAARHQVIKITCTIPNKRSET